MDIFILLVVLFMGAYLRKARDQKRRIALLGSHLGRHQIEKLLEDITQGYLRALGEPDSQRQEQIWVHLGTAERAACEQFNRFVSEFSSVAEAQARVSKLAFSFPFAEQLFPGATFDLRQLLSVHARGITQAVTNEGNQSHKRKAFTLSAELFLMQHTCHWFCRSKTVASARMMVRHKTSYAQLLAAVAPETRKAYCAVTGIGLVS